MSLAERMQTEVPTDTEEVYLRHTHPNLYRQLLIWVFLCFGFAAVLFIKSVNPTTTSVSPVIAAISRPTLGALCVLTGSMLLYGISNGQSRYKWARRALLVIVGMGLLVGVSYWISIILGKTDIFSFALFWSVWGLSAVVWSSEPVFNPISSTVNRGKSRGR